MNYREVFRRFLGFRRCLCCMKYSARRKMNISRCTLKGLREISLRHRFDTIEIFECRNCQFNRDAKVICPFCKQESPDAVTYHFK